MTIFKRYSLPKPPRYGIRARIFRSNVGGKKGVNLTPPHKQGAPGEPRPPVELADAAEVEEAPDEPAAPKTGSRIALAFSIVAAAVVLFVIGMMAANGDEPETVATVFASAPLLAWGVALLFSWRALELGYVCGVVIGAAAVYHTPRGALERGAIYLEPVTAIIITVVVMGLAYLSRPRDKTKRRRRRWMRRSLASAYAANAPDEPHTHSHAQAAAAAAAMNASAAAAAEPPPPPPPAI